MEHSTVIRTLGGPHAVANMLRARGVPVADVTVRSWTLEGRKIPAKYWHHIADIAREEGVEMSFEALAQAIAAPSQTAAAA